MDAPSHDNLFDNIEPHRHLPGEARAALWAACELVRSRPGEFMKAAAWLDREYSETAVCERELRDSARICRRQLSDLRAGSDPCDTFPRRKALRHGTPRAVLVDQTIRTAQFRGMRLRRDQIIISDDLREDDAVVGAGNVEAAWRAMDERCRQSIRHFKDERRKRDAHICRGARDRMGRFLGAVREAVNGDIPLSCRVEFSRRIVLLAAMIASPEELSLSAEFGEMPWATEGSVFGIGGPYMPGRETLFDRHDLMNGMTRWSIAGFTADAFGNLIFRAVNVCGMSMAREVSMAAMQSDSKGSSSTILARYAFLDIQPPGNEFRGAIWRVPTGLPEADLADLLEKMNAYVRDWSRRIYGRKSGQLVLQNAANENNVTRAEWQMQTEALGDHLKRVWHHRDDDTIYGRFALDARALIDSLVSGILSDYERALPPELLAQTSNSTTETRALPQSVGKGMPWQDAMRVAEDHCARNPFPGVNALAKIVRETTGRTCSKSTILKAIDHSAKLRAKQAEHEAQRKSVSAGFMNEETAASANQTRERDPLEAASTDEIFHALVEQSKESERARLNAMSDTQRRELVEAMDEDSVRELFKPRSL